MDAKVEKKLLQIAAMAFLGASDERNGRKPSRAPQMLEFIIEWIERTPALSEVVQPELERLGKQLGFDVVARSTAPGSKETH